MNRDLAYSPNQVVYSLFNHYLNLINVSFFFLRYFPLKVKMFLIFLSLSVLPGVLLS